MTTLLKITAFTGLALSILPAFLVFAGTITWGTYQALMVAGMVLWFGSALVWIKPEKTDD